MSRRSFPVRVKAKDIPLSHRRPPLMTVPVVFPRLGRLGVRAWLRMPASRLRTYLLEYTTREYAMGSLYRHDVKFMAVFQSPDLELRPAPEVAALVGWPEVVRGREAAERYLREWHEVWGKVAFIPKEIIDFGDKILVLSTVDAVGAISGIAMNATEEAELWEWQKGRLVRHTQWWRSWGDALEAVGLSE